ncbi:MAG TPA: LuxR C-terminal-related transcriptional regulator [Acidimicrobiales bacterium]|nr:LuxR C-terminal-related transcriptional regulator [Acidimicrobiales bacterium]
MPSPGPSSVTAALVVCFEEHVWDDEAAFAAAVAAVVPAVAATVASHGGTAVDPPLEALFAATFRRLTEAVSCALALQEGSSLPQDVPSLCVALHAAESQPALGPLAGDPIERAARLLSLAGPGQFLLSRSTGDLLRERLPDGAELVDLGVHRPRDLGRPEHVLSLLGKGTGSVVVPLRSLDAVPNNLPVQLTSFVGREDELDKLTRVLDGTRVLTLAGPGGCGKTRLALRLGAATVDAHPDGVWVADLAAVADAALLPSVVAAALGIGEIPFQPLDETIVERLRTKTALVVLDNCEHLVEACAALAERLTGACPALVLLATSREPLGCAGEVTWRVPSLSLPEGGDVARAESVRLFVDRASAARPSFRLDAGNAEAVGDVCRQLDGIPLAIELAAARARAMTPEQIAVQLADRFALLTGGRLGALPRHRTLEASVDWSYSLLSDGERVLLCRLAVFAQGFDLAAAEAVCAGDGLERWAVLDALTGLVDRSLAVVQDEVGRGRYRLLETIRQYAFAKLIEAGEVASLRDRHLEYYGARAAEAGVDLEGRDAIRVLAELELEVDNFRAAFDWAMQSGRAEEAWRLAGSLWLFWQRNRAEEGASRLAAALKTPGGDPLGRAKALHSLGDLAFFCGDFAGGGQYLEECVPLAEASGDAKMIGRALNGIGVTGVFMQELDAVDYIERALVLHSATDDAYFWVDSLTGLMLAGWFTGDADLAKRAADEALQVGRSSGNPTTLVRALGIAVMAACARGDLDEWEAPAEEAIAICLELRDEISGPVVLSYLARHRGMRGFHDDALEAAEVALSRAQAVNSDQGIAPALWAKAITERDAGRETALATLAQAIEAAMNAGLVPFAAECAATMTSVSIAAGDLTAAREAVAAVSALADGHYGQGSRGWALQAAGELALAEDNLEEATTAIHQALTAWTEIGNGLGVVATLEQLAHLNVHANRSLEAARLLGATDAERERLAWPVAPADRQRRDADWAALEAAMGTEALAVAHAEGATMDTKEAVAYARRGRGTRRKASSGWSSLTATELEVVRLVADGLRNAEIAERLFMSTVTAKSHVAHVFAKLGVSNRAELAAYAIPRLADPD